MKRILAIFVCILFLSGAVHAQTKGNTTNDSFNKAKRILLQQVYKGKGTTFYCGCPFKGKKLLICQNYIPKRVFLPKTAKSPIGL
jgi:endonuclease I